MKRYVVSWILLSACTPSQPQAPSQRAPKDRGSNGAQSGETVVVDGPKNQTASNQNPNQAGNAQGPVGNANGTGTNTVVSGGQTAGSSGQQSAGGQSTVISQPGQTGSSGPMCKRANFLGGGKLGLSLTEGDDAFFRPLTVLVTLNDGASTCTGFLYNQKHGFGEMKDGKAVSSEIRFLMLPRISLAAHCMLLTDGKISKIRFTMVDDANKFDEYEVDPSGYTVKDGPWHINLEDLKAHAAAKAKNPQGMDPCSIQQKSQPAAKVACFSPEADRFEITTRAEALARANAEKFNFSYALDAADLEKYGKFGVFGPVDAQAGQKINWAQLFDDERAKYVAPLTYRYNALLTAEDLVYSQIYPKSRAELFQMLNERLEKISIISSIIREGDRPVIEILPKEGKWDNVLTIDEAYLDSKAIGYDKNQSINYAQIRAIGVQPAILQSTLGKGHSGTVMIGHWRAVSAPLLGMYTYRQILGVLTTVGGDDVCTGDDLTCCEKVQ
jgi:hypothetical protein